MLLSVVVAVVVVVVVVVVAAAAVLIYLSSGYVQRELLLWPLLNIRRKRKTCAERNNIDSNGQIR